MITYKLESSNVVGSGPYLVVAFDTDAEREQLGILLEAARIYGDRNEEYRDNWKRMGWRGQLVRVRERAERLWDSLWSAEPGALKNVRRLDDALDLVNFACFLVRAVREENRDGSWWEGT